MSLELPFPFLCKQTFFISYFCSLCKATPAVQLSLGHSGSAFTCISISQWRHSETRQGNPSLCLSSALLSCSIHSWGILDLYLTCNDLFLSLPPAHHGCLWRQDLLPCRCTPVCLKSSFSSKLRQSNSRCQTSPSLTDMPCLQGENKNGERQIIHHLRKPKEIINVYLMN